MDIKVIILFVASLRVILDDVCIKMLDCGGECDILDKINEIEEDHGEVRPEIDIASDDDKSGPSGERCLLDCNSESAAKKTDSLLGQIGGDAECLLQI